MLIERQPHFESGPVLREMTSETVRCHADDDVRENAIDDDAAANDVCGEPSRICQARWLMTTSGAPSARLNPVRARASRRASVNRSATRTSRRHGRRQRRWSREERLATASSR